MSRYSYTKDVVNRFRASFTSIFTKIFQLLPKTTPPVLPPQQAPAADHQNIDWAMIMIGFCLPSAIEIALQSLQVQSQLPLMFHFLSLAVIFSFTFLFLGKLMRTRFPIAAQVLEGLGLLFAVTTIFVAVIIPLPLWLKCLAWTLYAILLIAITICILYNRI
ncbi:hypothetical protein CUMW_033330 [Citrus unshiu]|nr:hypothetical protein CUMW_033330 [Citrus unshiu]